MLPLENLVCFAPGGWPVAVAGAASAVAGGQGDALASGVEALLTPNIQWLVVVNVDFGDRAAAGQALNAGHGDRVGLTFDAPVIARPESGTTPARRGRPVVKVTDYGGGLWIHLPAQQRHAVQRAERLKLDGKGGPNGKTIVVGALERGGELRARTVPDSIAASLQTFIN